MMPLTDVTKARDLFDETEARHRRFARGNMTPRTDEARFIGNGWHVGRAGGGRRRKGDVETLPDGTKRVHMRRRDWERMMRNRPESHEDAALDSEV